MKQRLVKSFDVEAGHRQKYFWVRLNGGVAVVSHEHKEKTAMLGVFWRWQLIMNCYSSINSDFGIMSVVEQGFYLRFVLIQLALPGPLGLPNFFPEAFTALNASFVREEINSLSISAAIENAIATILLCMVSSSCQFPFRAPECPKRTNQTCPRRLQLQKLQRPSARIRIIAIDRAHGRTPCHRQ